MWELYMVIHVAFHVSNVMMGPDMGGSSGALSAVLALTVMVVYMIWAFWVVQFFATVITTGTLVEFNLDAVWLSGAVASAAHYGLMRGDTIVTLTGLLLTPLMLWGDPKQPTIQGAIHSVVKTQVPVQSWRRRGQPSKIASSARSRSSPARA